MFASLNRHLTLKMLIVAAVPFVSAQAIDLGPDQPRASIKLGRLGAAVARASDNHGVRYGHIEDDWSTGVSFDYPVSPHLLVGPTADFQWIDNPVRRGLGLVGGYRTVELGVNLKARLNLYRNRVVLNPYVGVGGCEAIRQTLLALRAGLELQTSLTSRFGIGVEAGVWYAPLATDISNDYHVGPAGFMRGQLLIAPHPWRKPGGSGGQLPITLTSTKIPKPVMFLVGQMQPGMITYVQPDLCWKTVHLRDGLSLGATAQIPLMRHLYLGPCLDYSRVKPFTSYFVWSAELLGDLKVIGPLRVQGGAGVGYSILHGDWQSFDQGYAVNRLCGRLLFQQPSEIGWVVEYVRWNPSANAKGNMEALKVFRFGVVL